MKLKGTTNIAFIYKGGIVIAVDSRITDVDQGKDIIRKF
jgi:20S proteasome alpha/beta subunit